MSPSLNSRCVRSIMRPSFLASMNKVSPRCRRRPRARNHRQAGIWGRIEQLARQGDHAINEARFDQRLSDIAFAGLIRGHRSIGQHEAGNPFRRQVMDHVLHPGKVRIAPRCGTPNFQRLSSASRSPPQSDTLNGGLARMKSAFRSGCRSSWKLSPWAICPLMPRIARFIWANRQVV